MADINYFDNLPSLSKEESFDILSRPVNKLRYRSDYYKAVSNLLKYPCIETEDILINLLKFKSSKQYIYIAKRKAIEVLSLLGCKRAIPIIGDFLYSDDPYLIENSVLALQKLKCNKIKYHNLVSSLLDKPKQNRRILIQYLGNMNVYNQIPKIKSLILKKNLNKGIYGAGIAALCKLTKDKSFSENLEVLLKSCNQNDRQSAIQDVIDAEAIELLPKVIKMPVSPFFKLNAINKLWDFNQDNHHQFNIFELLENVMQDDPNNIDINPVFNEDKSIDFLVDQFYSTDFNRCYFSLKILLRKNPDDLWDVLDSNLDRLQRDYGALYFLINLCRMHSSWNKIILEKIWDINISAIDSNWPDYIKFRPSAIISLINLKPFECDSYIKKWLDISQTPYWACRYAALMALESNLPISRLVNFRTNISILRKDKNPFISIKAKALVNSMKI